MKPLAETEARSMLASLGVFLTDSQLGQVRTYLETLDKWNRRINLVGASTLRDPWRRHIVDSAQLWAYRPAECRRWVDLGAGGGLPGVIVAILAEKAVQVTLVESDRRKAEFLRTVTRQLKLNATVEAARIETVALEPQDVVSARALAPLSQLIGFAKHLISSKGTCLFLKGAQYSGEIAEAKAAGWNFSCGCHNGYSGRGGVILVVQDIQYQ